MNKIKEFLQDNKHVYVNYGIKFLIIVYLKLLGYLVILPLINLFLLWKFWYLAILQAPFTYLGIIIALQGAEGVSRIQLKLFRALNTVKAWMKR